MIDDKNLDTLQPWTVKAVSKRTVQGITKAAKMEGLNVGQWLDRKFAEWVAEGSPVVVGPAPSLPAGTSLTDLGAFMEVARKVIETTGVSDTAKRAANTTLSSALRHGCPQRGARALTAAPAKDSAG